MWEDKSNVLFSKDCLIKNVFLATKREKERRREAGGFRFTCDNILRLKQLSQARSISITYPFFFLETTYHLGM